MKIEINDQFKQAFQTIETTNNCVFVTGNAGTGKTTFLKYFLAKTQKKSLVLAPTGVAALNAGGQTIHSFFKFKPNVTLSKIKKKKLSEESIYKKVETIVIDEASMLRCDILDCIDRFLRLNRERQREVFGGVQIVFIGDLKQLPPVVTPTERIIFETQYNSPYFLNALCLQEAQILTITLTKNYRQQDQNFIDLLNAIRDQRVSEEMFRKLNKQVGRLEAGDKLTIYLCTTNKKAAAVNAERLTQISEPAFVFEAQTDVPAEINLFPADAHLTIKKGAQVMMLNNDFADRWVNGSIG
ncbi:MAG: AAA family ATPase, partial [Elusimicrobiota bacterium]|nr:AAA family ATPase [Elusimicrobiota bacterium]